MSGYKRATVTISEEEYRRLHQADMERRFKGTSKKVKVSRQSTELNNAVQEMENRQRQLEQVLLDLNEDFNGAGASMMQELLAQNAQSYENLAAMIEETNSNTNISFGILSQRFAEELQREREQYQQQLQSLLRRVATYEQAEQSKAQAARRWLRQCVALTDHLQERFDHERFVPGKLSRLLNSLNLAQNNLAEGFYESSLQTSQQVFLQLFELRFELEQRIMEWQTQYARTQSALSQFVSELEMNSSVNAFGLEGEELTEQVDLNYWSNGKYGELLDKSRQLLRLLSQEQRTISMEELQRTCDEFLPMLVNRFESILYDARLNALNSQLRMNIAESALQALESQGFKLNDAGYANQDMRAAFTVTLVNPDGSQVLVEVLPSRKSNQELTNELVVITQHPYLKTGHEARLQWQELCRTLGQYDLQVSRPEVHATPPLTAVAPAEHSPVLNEPLVSSERHHHVR
jgi:hypothetical protein